MTVPRIFKEFNALNLHRAWKCGKTDCKHCQMFWNWQIEQQFWDSIL